MNERIAPVVDLAASRGKLPFALREQAPATHEQPAITREQLRVDITEYLLNRAIDLQLLGEAEGKTPAEIRMELFEATMLNGLFGGAGYEAVKLALGVMDDPETAA